MPTSNSKQGHNSGMASTSLTQFREATSCRQSQPDQVVSRLMASTRSSLQSLLILAAATIYGTAFVAPARADNFVPITGGYASAVYQNSPSYYAQNVWDGNVNTGWSAGGFPQQWIVVDTGSTHAFTRISLLTSQYPAGQTVHSISMLNTAGTAWIPITTFSGYTDDNQWLNIQFPQVITGHEFLIITSQSPSWVGWREIQLFEASTGAPFQAGFVGWNPPPPTALPGQQFNVSVTMQNNGNETWTSANSYTLGSQNPDNNVSWGTGRVALPYSVAPGQQAVFSFTVTAPSTPNIYNFQWRMLQENYVWFGDPTPNVAVSVSSGQQQVQSILEPDDVGTPCTRGNFIAGFLTPGMKGIAVRQAANNIVDANPSWYQASANTLVGPDASTCNRGPYLHQADDPYGATGAQSTFQLMGTQGGFLLLSRDVNLPGQDGHFNPNVAYSYPLASPTAVFQSPSDALEFSADVRVTMFNPNHRGPPKGGNGFFPVGQYYMALNLVDTATNRPLPWSFLIYDSRAATGVATCDFMLSTFSNTDLSTGAPCIKYVTINPGSHTLQLGGSAAPYGAWSDLRSFSLRVSGANLSAAIAAINSSNPPPLHPLSTSIANYILTEVAILHEMVWDAPDQVDSASSFQNFTVRRYFSN
jgi:hypothetical protein